MTYSETTQKTDISIMDMLKLADASEEATHFFTDILNYDRSFMNIRNKNKYEVSDVKRLLVLWKEYSALLEHKPRPK